MLGLLVEFSDTEDVRRREIPTALSYGRQGVGLFWTERGSHCIYSLAFCHLPQRIFNPPILAGQRPEQLLKQSVEARVGVFGHRKQWHRRN